jgi:hypothetical protein
MNNAVSKISRKHLSQFRSLDDKANGSARSVRSVVQLFLQSQEVAFCALLVLQLIERAPFGSAAREVTAVYLLVGDHIARPAGEGGEVGDLLTIVVDIAIVEIHIHGVSRIIGARSARPT